METTERLRSPPRGRQWERSEPHQRPLRSRLPEIVLPSESPFFDRRSKRRNRGASTRLPRAIATSAAHLSKRVKRDWLRKQPKMPVIIRDHAKFQGVLSGPNSCVDLPLKSGSRERRHHHVRDDVRPLEAIEGRQVDALLVIYDQEHSARGRFLVWVTCPTSNDPRGGIEGFDIAESRSRGFGERVQLRRSEPICRCCEIVMGENRSRDGFRD